MFTQKGHCTIKHTKNLTSYLSFVKPRTLPFIYTFSGAVAGGDRGAMPPVLLRPFGKLSLLSKIVKVVDGGSEDLKCCRPENFFGLSEKFFGLRKSAAIGSPKNMGTTAPLYTFLL